MADSCKTTTFSTTTSSDSISQQMDSTRMTTANVSHHNQQKEEERKEREEQQRNVQSLDIACTRTAATTITANCGTLQTLLSLPTGMELSQIELIYRAEGNANLVLALPQFKKVLRLPKSAAPIITTTTSTAIREEKLRPSENSDCNLKSPQAQSELLEEQKPHKQAEKAEKASVTEERESQSRDDLTMKDFASYMQIFRQILGIAYVLEPEICWIHQEDDRKWINKHIRAARPAHRLDKEFCGQFGLLLPDATQLPSIQADILHCNLQPEAKVNKHTYAIEIKPKQGWQLFPNPDASSSQNSSIATSNLDIKDLFSIRPTTSTAPLANPTLSTSTPTAAKVARTTVARCRYCAMQFLKLKNHKISHMNTYCPIELFSGIPSRMLYALDALFRCPQNNLRIFKNGVLIYGDHANSISYEELRKEFFPGNIFQVVKNLLVECLLKDYDATFPKDSESIEIKKAFTDVVGAFGQPHSGVAMAKLSRKESTTTLKIIQTNPDTETKEHCEQQVQETQAVQVKTSSTTSITRTKLPRKTTESLTMKTSVPSQIQHIDAEMPCLPKNCILQKILHLQLLIKRNLISMKDADYGSHKQKTYNALRSLLKYEKPLDIDKLQTYEEYLLGATALDCSIMIAFREISESEKLNDTDVETLTDLHSAFHTKVTVLDLDPKPDSHFSKYIQQTKEAYEESSKN